MTEHIRSEQNGFIMAFRADGRVKWSRQISPAGTDTKWKYTMGGCMVSGGNDYLVILGNAPLSLIILRRSSGKTYRIRKHDNYHSVDFVHSALFATASTAFVGYNRRSSAYVTRMKVAANTVWEARISA